MKIFVKAKTGVKRERVEKIDDTHFLVAVKEQPVGGKANDAILKAVADYFRVPRRQVTISSGRISRQKIIEIQRP